MYIFEVHDGNYLWDKDCQLLIEIGSDDNIVVEGLHLAYPIPIPEDLLHLIGFSNCLGGYQYNKDTSIVINIDGKNPNGLLTLWGQTIICLSDIQNAFEAHNLTLDIDKDQLLAYLKDKNKNNHNN